ncbi:MAG: DUF374 domain-containing protein [Acidobacteriota bacterium]
MKVTTHNNELYLESGNVKGSFEEAEHHLANIEVSVAQSSAMAESIDPEQGRNLLTRTIDRILTVARRYFPITYHILIALGAFCLFIYARLVMLTVRFIDVGEKNWSHLPTPCVLAIWHGCMPSLLVALAAGKPSSPITIMITLDPRGDLLTILCHLLHLRVVRGGSRAGGWLALDQLAHELENGSTVVITPDGGGPARVAKVGAVALASATGVPLAAIGADCRPAIIETHKWDAARNPLPFSRIVVAIGAITNFPVFTDLASLNAACHWLQNALSDAASAAKQGFL